MSDLRLNQKPAVRIAGYKVRGYKEAVLINCEGDLVWFPANCVKFEVENKTVLIEEWLYNKKVNEGQL